MTVGRVARWKTNGLALLAILALACGIYGFLLRPGQIPYSKHSDVIAQHLATKEIAHRSLERGDGLPYWRGDQILGVPAVTHPQSLYTNPLHAPFLWMEPAAAVGWTLFLSLLAMAVSMWALGAALELSAIARVLMSVSGLVSFKLIAICYAGWLPVIPVFVVCPLLFASVIRLAKRPGLPSALLFAVAGALSLSSGNVQIAYYSSLLLVGYVAATLAGALRREPWRPAVRLPLWALAGSLLAIGLVAHLWLPIASDAPLLTRADSSYEFAVTQTHHLHARDLLTLLHPHWLGTPLDGTYPGDELWEDVAYFGFIPLALAVIGAIGGWSRGTVGGLSRATVRFLVISFAVSIALSADTPVLRAVYAAVPGYGVFRIPNRFLFVTTIVGIALAGAGLDWMIARWRRRNGSPRIAMAVVGILLVATAAEGTYYARRYLTMKPQTDVLPEPSTWKTILDDSKPFRVAPLGEVIPAGWAALEGLEVVTGYDAYTPRHYRIYFDVMSSGSPGPERPVIWTRLDGVARPDMLGALNVEYLVSPQPIEAEGLDLVQQTDPILTFSFYIGLERRRSYVYRVATFKQRAYWADDIAVVANEREEIEGVRTHNLGTTAVVRSADRVVSGPASPGDSVVVNEVSDGVMTAETVSAQARFLVVSESWHPGWTATIDGRPQRIYKTDVALMGIEVPAGEHEVALRFRPQNWGLAKLANAISVGMVCLLAAFAVWRRRRRDLGQKDRGGADEPTAPAVPFDR